MHLTSLQPVVRNIFSKYFFILLLSPLYLSFIVANSLAFGKDCENPDQYHYPDQYPYVLLEDTCKDVVKIAWDSSNNENTVADNSSMIVTVSGGRPPYYWTIQGDGFYLDNDYSLHEISTDVPFVKVFTNNACGYCYITVTDNCTRVKEGIRSVDGKWVGDCVIAHVVTGCQWATGWFVDQLSIGCSVSMFSDCALLRNDPVVSTEYRHYAGTSANSTVYEMRRWNPGLGWTLSYGILAPRFGTGALCDDLAELRKTLANNINVYDAEVESPPPAPIHGPAPKGTSCNSSADMCRWSCN